MSEETTKVKTVTRTDAANQAIMSIEEDRSPVLVDTLAAWVENAVVSSSGTEDPAASLRSVNKALKAAEGLGVVRLHKTVTVERIG